ncbi:MAG: UDP-N-acetylglucosamine 2-epimerase (non-hydrolyzing) [Elusimicrobia bacterium]|nr:UDP-N-acetylglucosamine 2-epimerase (non-hydrolyzing) [Elusimicrobiota bacterium]
MNKKIKIISVVGARPNFMKIAPLSAEFAKRADKIEHILVHTGQHYDRSMDKIFFEELNLPKPHINLGIGSASHAVQTAKIMIGFEKVCLKYLPDWIVVVGDVNSTMACSLVASKMGIKVAHVEAGLRSFDMSMPEEINRVVTDSISDLLFTPSPDANANLLREGIDKKKIKMVGNIMIDTLIANLDKALAQKTHLKMDLKEKYFVYVTLHRPNNVDSKENLGKIVKELVYLSGKIPVVFAVHPRTKKNMLKFSLMDKLKNSRNIILAEPLGYHDSICLTKNARFILTDSGGIQEETTFLKVPCLTIRPSTERPVTITEGTNKLTNIDELQKNMSDLLSKMTPKKSKIPKFWDGKTAKRIVDILFIYYSALSLKRH